MANDNRRSVSVFREFLDGEAAGGIILIAAAALALIVANSPLAETYFAALHAYLGPLSLLHWINDALMAVFFLLVGLEIKREVLDGQLSTWPRRMLPGIAAAGGMAVPALVYVAINRDNAAALPGWAIPTATDIAFALGVLSLLGNRVPASLKVFLTALAIIDDLGAVVIIALFYTSGLSFIYLAAALAVIVVLVVLNRMGVLSLIPYLVLGVVLWVLVLKSGVHATLAGVALALTIPLKATPGIAHDLEHSPLHQLEHALHRFVPLIIIPIFGFANAGVSLAGLTPAALVEPLTLGVAAGLVLGKLVGVLGASALAIKLGLADLPMRAGWMHMTGIALLCGIGFTMSLFIGLLAFANSPELQDAVKVGILAGSLIAALGGAALLMAAPSVADHGEDE
ncbi:MULTISPECIES: Na+/H+ antiporter NhaA [Phyllobacteriaceae]|jgi:Na+:H+ antiporter, NhaA family|uniref:Na(+)/H(+) antiporter NhaA n=1 Tax=Mesorhizobium hungaricum TaxID=1566387 RepID=A0A1C2DE57_9HYPH|nr:MULTISPECIES: Na+/H+ antiporter NhaA [Mesorhizobium]MBN9232871.1 Na+/H+ antiporter NhaA [Mesorhizobium sp.]MDQ0330474.1 NhaA family Na+:H+ antiporter [Mesorhizobium sp. YL-MeA3-2017]OCX13049.1 Na(+)/H(+) antiporter NhaA [Mesorhizobium hungaricum]